MKKKHLEKIYEKFFDEEEPNEEIKKENFELIEKFSKLKSKLNEELVDEFDELESLFSKVNYSETKAAFCKGFSVATNIILEARE